MAALAYVLLPLSGLFASLLARDPRVRFHGLQAVVLGVTWPAALYGASAASPAATRVVFVVGAIIWLGFMVLAGLGRNPGLPLVAQKLRRASEVDLRETV